MELVIEIARGTFIDERFEGERWRGVAARGVLLGGGVFEPLLLDSSSVSSSSAGSGRGGRGGLVGGEIGPSCLETEPLCVWRNFGVLSLSFLSFSCEVREERSFSNVMRTPVSRRASSGVRTTVAPEPRAPLRVGDRMSMLRTSFGSETLTGFEGE